MKRTVSGVGVGLRTPHIPDILQQEPDIPWLELLADNWLAPGGLTRDYLLAISERYPVTLHGVGLSLGAVTPLDVDYLQRIKDLQQQTQAVWYSEHCSFSEVHGEHIPDLLPLPYTEEAIDHISERINLVQDVLGQPLLLENVSSYLEYPHSQLHEADFLNAIADKTDCHLLLDINNIYVTAFNQQKDPQAFLQRINTERIKEIHLAGFQVCTDTDTQPPTDYLLDAHNHPVDNAVWELYRGTVDQMGNIPTLIEWDSELPTLDILLTERSKAENIQNPLAIGQQLCS